jgi:hypothetical protein
VAAETIALIMEMARNNQLWGVLPLDMVDKSISPFQTHFGPVFCLEAVQISPSFP